MSNPFVINPARVPSNYIDRVNTTESVISAFTDGSSEYAKYIVGVRGSGKTVMMNYICDKLSDMDFICVKINPMSDIYDSAVSSLKTHKSVLSAFDISIDISSPDNDVWSKILPSFKAGVKFDFSKSSEAYKEIVLREIVSELTKKKKKVLFAIDEIYKCTNIAMFSQTIQTMVGEHSDVYLLMTGLPENVKAVQRDKRCSFLARIMEVWTSPLSDFSICNSYMKIFDIERDTAKVLASYINGYSYAYQLLGYILWDVGKKPALNVDNKLDEDILLRYMEGLFSAQYDLIWEELSENEIKVMTAIACAASSKTEDVINASGMTAASYNQYRDVLYKRKKLIDCSRHGYVTFTLPCFKEYILYK